MDSNHRRRKPTRLQRVPFSRSGTRPWGALYKFRPGQLKRGHWPIDLQGASTQPMRERPPGSPRKPPRRLKTRPPRGRPAGRPAFGERAHAADAPVILYGWHTVTAALENPARRIRRLYATENAARRLADQG